MTTIEKTSYRFMVKTLAQEITRPESTGNNQKVSTLDLINLLDPTNEAYKGIKERIHTTLHTIGKDIVSEIISSIQTNEDASNLEIAGDFNNEETLKKNLGSYYALLAKVQEKLHTITSEDYADGKEYSSSDLATKKELEKEMIYHIICSIAEGNKEALNKKDEFMKEIIEIIENKINDGDQDQMKDVDSTIKSILSEKDTSNKITYDLEGNTIKEANKQEDSTNNNTNQIKLYQINLVKERCNAGLNKEYLEEKVQRDKICATSNI